MLGAFDGILYVHIMYVYSSCPCWGLFENVRKRECVLRADLRTYIHIYTRGGKVFQGRHLVSLSALHDHGVCPLRDRYMHVHIILAVQFYHHHQKNLTARVCMFTKCLLYSNKFDTNVLV